MWIELLISLPAAYLAFRLVTWYTVRQQAIRDLCKIPGPPAPSLVGPPSEWHYLLLGHLPRMVKWGTHITEALYETIPAVLEEFARSEGIIHLQLGPLYHVVGVKRLDHVTTLLSSSVNLNKAPEYGYMRDWMGEGLITSSAEKWRLRRKLIDPTLHQSVLKRFIPIDNEQSRVLMDLFRRDQAAKKLDIRDYTVRFAMDVLAETVLGVQLNCQTSHQSDDFMRAVEDFCELFTIRNAVPPYWFDPLFRLTPTGRRYYGAADGLHRMSRHVITERLKLLQSDSNEYSERSKKIEWDDNGNLMFDDDDGLKTTKRRLAFLDLLLDEHMKNPTGFTLKDVQEETDTFIMGGHDTTAKTLGFALFLLGHHPVVQDRARAEQVSIFRGFEEKDFHRDVTHEDLSKMVYLEQIIRETLRLYTPVPIVGRQTSQEVYLDRYRIPAGTVLLIGLWMLHRDPQVWGPNPEAFDPDRFTAERSAGRSPFAYVPFSAGPRRCIGQKFSMLELKVVLSHVLRNFRLTSCTPLTGIRLGMEMVIKAKSPIEMRFEPI